jgi:RHS repeat-associated protein
LTIKNKSNYEYDTRDQMRRVVNGAAEVAQYDYDYERRRIGKSQTQGASWQEYEYDGSRVVNEYQRTVTADVVQQIRSARYEYGIDLLRGQFGAVNLWYYSDALGSVTALSNASGTIQTAYGYNAWGERTVGSDWGGAGSPLNNLNAIGYTGQFFDNETGLMPLGNGERYYNPALGRFTQQDSFSGVLGETASLNRYSYGHNNPNKYTDPSGHFGLIATTAIGFGVGYVAGFLLDAAHQGVDILSGEQQGFDLERADASGQFAAKFGAVIGSLGVAAEAAGVGAAFTVGLTIGGVGTGAAATAINLQEGRYGHAAVDAVATLLPFAFKGVRTATAKSFKDFGRGGYTGNVKPAGFQGWKQSWENLKGNTAAAETVAEGTRTLESGKEPLLLNPAPEEVLQRGRANPIGEQGVIELPAYERFEKLATDPQTGTKIIKSIEEAMTIIDAEEAGIVKGARRPNLKAGEPDLDFVVDGGYADAKNPRAPGRKNSLAKQAGTIAYKIWKQSNDANVKIIVDLKRLNPSEKTEFKQLLENTGADMKKVEYVNDNQ